MTQKRRKILVADDDPAICDAIKIILEDEGYIVETSVNGETIYKMEKDYPDLLLLDIWMSGMDGRHICRYLKTQESTQHIPIIMISANKDTDKMAKDAGANDFIAKPFQLDLLLQKVKEHIKNSD